MPSAGEKEVQSHFPSETVLAPPLVEAPTVDGQGYPGRSNGAILQLLRRPRFTVPAAGTLLLCMLAAFPGVFSGWFGHGDPRQCTLDNSGLGPREGHPFGFDIQGCDLYSNVIYGARTSLSIGLLTTLLTLVVAITLGALAGYFGGSVDMLISRVMDVFFGFPTLIGMIVVLQAFSVHNIVSVSLVLALFSWPILTRVMRAAVLETRSLDYIDAARSVGAGPVRILVRHVVPNSLTPVAVLSGLNVAAVITAESGLTFLGVGMKAPAISWGVQLNTAQQYFSDHLHLLLFPALFLSASVLCFVLLGDAVKDAFDPERR
ncbi:ABC transporter permease [Streptomyces canus]|uniref:ABC transporter permease n=1 Tax=Streptomyces canus TaxID=58343 RepID=UPI0033C013EF